MPDFTGASVVYLQPTTSKYPLAASFAACSSATANDGSIPYGATISSATIVSTDADGTVVTDLIDAASTSVSGSTVSCTLSYPSTSGAGTYTLEYRLVLSTTAVLVYDATRVIAGDRSA